jgi:signal peptidase
MMVLSKDEKKKHLSKASKVINGIFSTIILAVFILALAAMIYLLVQFVGGKSPSLFGYRFYFVLTDSMDPTLKPTDMILSKVVKDNTDIDYVKEIISEGDIVTYQGKVNQNDAPITHRVILQDGKDDIFFYDENKESWMLITKGDNNIVADQPIPITSLNAVMVSKAGFVSAIYNFISNKSGGFLLLLIPIILVLIPFIIRLVVIIKSPPDEEEKDKITDDEKKLIEEEIARKAVQDYIKQHKEKEKENDTL